VAEGIADAHDCVAEVRIDQGYPVTKNDARAIALVRDIAEELEEGSWRTMPAPMMGGEDFSYVLRKVPGAMAFIGAAPAGSDPAANPPLHNTRMTIDEGVFAKGVAMHCAFAARVLEDGLPA
jgi:hippurate hydrolase